MGRRCYWGFATRQNQLAWLFLVACLIIGAALWIPGAVETRRCNARFMKCADCMESAGTGRLVCGASSNDAARFERCRAQYMSCIRTPAVLWAIGGFFLVVLIWIPCCYFCCCAHAPFDSQDGGGMYAPGTQNVQMAYPTGTPYGGYPNGTAAAHPVAYPPAMPAGQPMYPTPHAPPSSQVFVPQPAHDQQQMQQPPSVGQPTSGPYAPGFGQPQSTPVFKY